MRYFFSARDGGQHTDDVGVELPDHNAARKEAVKYAGEVMQSEPDVLWDGHDFRVQVTDDEGVALFTIVSLAIDTPASRAG